MEWMKKIVKTWSEKLARGFGRPPKLGSCAKNPSQAVEILASLLPFWKTFQPWQLSQITLVTPEEKIQPAEVCLWILEDKSLFPLLKTSSYAKSLVHPLEKEEIYQTLPLEEAIFFAIWSNSPSLKEKASEDLIWHTSLKAALIGAIPIPFLDALFLLPLQTGAVWQLSVIYGHKWDWQRAKDTTSTLMTSFFVHTLRRNLGKFLPLFGSAAGGALAGSATYALLHLMQQKFLEKSPFSFSQKEMQKEWEKHYQKAKQIFSPSLLQKIQKIQKKLEKGELPPHTLEEELQNLSHKNKREKEYETG